MPLGQAPYGSRTPSAPEPAGPARSPLGDPRRWLLWVAMAAMLSWLATDCLQKRSKPSGPVECLTDKACQADERCYVVPKDDSGFASPGLCLKACAVEADCAAPLKCAQVSVRGSHVEPPGSTPPPGEPVTICRLP